MNEMDSVSYQIVSAKTIEISKRRLDKYIWMGMIGGNR